MPCQDCFTAVRYLESIIDIFVIHQLQSSTLLVALFPKHAMSKPQQAFSWEPVLAAGRLILQDLEPSDNLNIVGWSKMPKVELERKISSVNRQ